MDKHIRDIIGKGDDEAPVLDMVIKDIFMSCDAENEGLVPVSKLVEFIMPFLQGNVHALEELQKSLDPDRRNPSIDIDTFYKDMNEWTLKISSADHLDEEDVHNITPRDFERIIDKDMSFLQSTPRSSFGHHLLKGYVESGISNLSIASSVNENQSAYFPDRTVLEEQIQQLQHQNRQVGEELARVRAELTSITEQNETLQADYDKVLKRLANEQKLNSQLQTERKKDDDCEEELCCTRKQVVKLERSKANLEKQNAQLQQELDAVLMERQGLECQIQRLDRKSEETKSSMVILQTEIDIRKSEVVSEHKTNEALTQHNQELCDIIEKCIINIDRLKLEKAMMRKFYRDKMSKGESLQGLNLNRSQRSNSFSEYAGISRKATDRRRVSDVTARFIPGGCGKPKPFNSPKLLRMLRDPVTPGLDGNSKSSGKRNELNLATMILNRSSTPYSNKQSQRPLLDMTPPIELNKIPVLAPRFLRRMSSEESIAGEMLDIILEKAMAVVSNGNGQYVNTPNSTESLPVMYVVERTPENGTSEVSSPTTPFSPKINDSSDEFFFYNYEMMSNSERQNENLLEEMAKATVCGIDEESECEESVSDVREKCDAEHAVNSSKTYVSEVHLKLDEYMDLEQKCEALEQRIEELESENSVKDRKIFDLNNEIEKLRQKLTVEDKNRIGDLLARIDELEKERNAHQEEKTNLLEEIKALNEEKAILQLSKEELLLKVVEYERKTHADRRNLLPSEFLSSKLRLLDTELIRKEKTSAKREDFECLKIDYERIKSTMDTYQKLNENLSSKNSFLQKTIREKEKQLEENLEEIGKLREESGNLNDKIHQLNVQLDDFKRISSSLERELIRKETDLERMEEKVFGNEKTIEDIDCTLKACESEKDQLKEFIAELQADLRKKSERLAELAEEGSKSEVKEALDETRRRLEQETKKQDYLCKKFVDLQNELVEEKNNTRLFREKYEDIQGDISAFKDTMAKLEHEVKVAEDRNVQLVTEHRRLRKLHEDKTEEFRSTLEAKNFIAKRNEELLQENAEIVWKYDMISRELSNKMALLEDMNKKLSEIEQLRLENRRIKIESDEILRKMRCLDSTEDGESDQVDSIRKESGAGSQRNREKKLGRRTNFDRLSMKNIKLEEKNATLMEQMTELKERLAKEIQTKNSVIAHANVIKDILRERRIRLGRATESAVDIWKSTLERYVSSELFADDLKPESPVLVFTAPLDEEMWQLKHQIHITTVLLSHLTCFMNRQMLRKNEFTQTDPEHPLALHRIGEVSTIRMEETFATLVLTYTVDKDLLRQRFHSAKSELGELERSLGVAISGLTLYLEQNARGLDASQFTSDILQLCAQVSIAAVQYGSLRQQTELTAAAEMMVNYVANLKQEIEILTQQLPAIGPTTSLDRMEFPEDTPIDLDVPRRSKTRKFLSCAKTTCIVFTLSVFVLVASLVLNTDLVFDIHRCPPPV